MGLAARAIDIGADAVSELLHRELVLGEQLLQQHAIQMVERMGVAGVSEQRLPQGANVLRALRHGRCQPCTHTGFIGAVSEAAEFLISTCSQFAKLRDQRGLGGEQGFTGHGISSAERGLFFGQQRVQLAHRRAFFWQAQGRIHGRAGAEAQ